MDGMIVLKFLADGKYVNYILTSNLIGSGLEGWMRKFDNSNGGIS